MDFVPHVVRALQQHCFKMLQRPCRVTRRTRSVNHSLIACIPSSSSALSKAEYTRAYTAIHAAFSHAASFSMHGVLSCVRTLFASQALKSTLVYQEGMSAHSQRSSAAPLPVRQSCASSDAPPSLRPRWSVAYDVGCDQQRRD
ncbi:hypothetical protein C8R45DRAFT_1100698 [Mycena sanguinolenta]|nr:hypothetical protein C8R45DRAFT_1100698 [Mycena sanguinolenta]